MPSLKARVVAVPSLEEAQRRHMYHLFGSYYDGVTEERFRQDLAGKDHVILLSEAGSGTLRGFSTLKNLELTVAGRRVFGVFSGDTVVEKEYWGSRALGIAFLRYMFQQKLRRLFHPLYWILITKGYKTYLIMANNFPEHYPRYEKVTPAQVQVLIEGFARHLFGGAYDAGRNLLDYGESHGHLKQGVAGISPSLQDENPRVAFFSRVNPTWASGTELVCLARMTWWMPLGYQLKSMFRLRSRGSK